MARYSLALIFTLNLLLSSNLSYAQSAEPLFGRKNDNSSGYSERYPDPSQLTADKAAEIIGEIRECPLRRDGQLISLRGEDLAPIKDCEKEEDGEYVKDLRKRIVELSSGWTEEHRNRVIQGALLVGMRAEHVRAILGPAHRIYVAESKPTGEVVQWAYSMQNGSQNIFLVNDIVVHFNYYIPQTPPAPPPSPATH